jgi:hypothetical protein
MDVKIKATLAFTVSSSALEDALAEYDEIFAKVEEGPNTLEEYDQLTAG